MKKSNTLGALKKNRLHTPFDSTRIGTKFKGSYAKWTVNI